MDFDSFPAISSQSSLQSVPLDGSGKNEFGDGCNFEITIEYQWSTSFGM